MSSTDMFMAAPTKGPSRVGQATEVAKARAATEVQGAIYIARQFPRDLDQARARMLAACAQIELAEKAFFSYPRGDSTITGLTIHAACELAQAWGNVEYGLDEMRRDDEYGQSETLAWAWDLETNVRISNTFIAPHMREAGKKTYRVTGMRDIYEVVTNQGNRRMRACILKMLPSWYVLAAETALRQTLRGKVNTADLASEISEATAAFADRYGVNRQQLEHKAGKPVERWDADDLVQLRILWETLDRREITPAEAFPEAKVTAEEIIGTDDAPAGSSPEPPAHTDHDPDALDSECPACRAESAAADRQASS